MADKMVYSGGFSNIQTPQQSSDDKPGCFLNVISFLIPIIGVILYFVKKSDHPASAKSYLKWAIISIVLGIVMSISRL